MENQVVKVVSPGIGEPFWKTVPVRHMSRQQWEALCDGCGRCCLQKLENATTGKVTYTWVSCYLLDTTSCRCTHYEMRRVLVPDCLELTPANVTRLRWLPRTCAYRRLMEGKPLLDWHPLLTGDPESVHQAGISVRDRAISEVFVHPRDFEYYEINRRW